MRRLRQAAARERRAPIYWWLATMLATGGGLVWSVHVVSRPAAFLLAVVLAAAWVAPLAALQSLAVPRRAKVPPPAPGAGAFGDWMKQARLLGRLLLYYGDNPDLPADVRQTLRAAREDLRDTLKAHPLRDDLERVCGRIRGGAVAQVKAWLWRQYGPRIGEIAAEYAQAAAGGIDEDARLLALQDAVANSAARMTHCCMPRMLERERLACAVDCAWLAMVAVLEHHDGASPVELAAAFVILWSDFSEPWNPAQAIRRAFALLASPGPAPAASAPPPTSAPAEGTLVVRNGKRYRRVRVRRQRRHASRRDRGPGIGDILLSFGQWVRYSIRAWMLYR